MAAAQQEAVGLVGDIGGTNARFAIARVDQGQVMLDHVLSLPGRDYPSLAAAAQDYLARVAPGPLDMAVAACAGPVVDGVVSFTNVAWTVSEAAFAAAIGVARVALLNDLAAVAWAAPALAPASLRHITRGDPDPTTGAISAPATWAILNAGTGCNASAYVQTPTGEAVVVGEYGHASFAPVDALEVAIWQLLHAEYGRVSIERVLAGPGLHNLYRALAAIEGVAAPLATPAQVSHAASAGDDLAGRAVSRFCALMGSVAGDVALCFGARGGVYLAGGVAVSLLTAPFDRVFRDRFEDKGRFADYLAKVPSWLIEDTNVALMGAARAMAARLQRS